MTAMQLHPDVAVPPPDLARFWWWLAGEVWTAPEFAALKDTDKAALAKLLRAEAGPWGGH